MIGLDRYANDPGLNPGDRVDCFSPTGTILPVDLRTREPISATG